MAPAIEFLVFVPPADRTPLVIRRDPSMCFYVVRPILSVCVCVCVCTRRLEWVELGRESRLASEFWCDQGARMRTKIMVLALSA